MPIRFCEGNPEFAADFRAMTQDRYFLTIKYADNSSHDISLMVPRIGPALPRIEKWVQDNLPEAQLEDWDVQVIDKVGGFKGLTGLMTMRSVA